MNKYFISCLWLLLSTATTAFAENWLAAINDDVFLYELSIPGTHDACTGNGFVEKDEKTGKQYALTQDVSLGNQWKSGIRAFDLRPAVHIDSVGNPSLVIFHGTWQTRLSMKEALVTLRDSLRKNPSEFAIVLMRHENSADKNDERWAGLMTELLHAPAFEHLFVAYHPHLTLGEMRGKILLLSRDVYADKPIGAYVRGWTHEPDFALQSKGELYHEDSQGALYVQDFYDTSEGKQAVALKCQSIKRLLDFSTTSRRQENARCPLVINHTSGYAESVVVQGERIATSEGYRKNASITNQYVIHYLKNLSHTGALGIIMMDYAGVDISGRHEVKGFTLTKEIIAHNFRNEKRPSSIPQRNL
ncbi:phosphatidylinositol-specific phospholipase C [Hoylesella timonensis]|uniref:phosphatidylinositol-specific phospholipase C n=1 Tax=Hoylesella timonensis TaxID=386414 RepID=UPI0006925459|nr:phosphatidylinositol-specific phospholipase C [Hoylesella timonensis]